jgi:hypothetical protein
MAPWVRAWSIATINALPSEASIGTFLTFTPGSREFTRRPCCVLDATRSLCLLSRHFS